VNSGGAADRCCVHGTAPSEDEIEALYEKANGNIEVEWNPVSEYGAVTFNREADTLADAIVTAVRDVEAVPGIQVVGAGQEDQVTMLDIAKRAGRTRESVRMLVNGQRGPGGFPHPALVTTGGEKIWPWPDVVFWLNDKIGLELDLPPHGITTADRVLAARAALAAEPDPDTRSALVGLLKAS
jgi:hypothetical protein